MDEVFIRIQGVQHYQDGMTTFIRAGTDWQPVSTARPGRRHSIFGSRRTAPGTPHDRRDIVALVPRRPPNVNVTMLSAGFSVGL